MLETGGQIEEAFILAREAEDREMMKRIILQHAQILQWQGRANLLREWLEGLPSDLIEQDEWLLFWKGAALVYFDLVLCRDFLERSYEKFKQKGEIVGMLLAWSGIVILIAHCLKGSDQLDYWIDELKTHIRDPFQEFPSPWIGARVSTSLFCALVQRQPGHPEIELWADRALSLTEDSQSNKDIRGTFLFYLVLYELYIGRFKKASLAVEMLNSFTQTLEDQSHLRITGYLGRGDVFSGSEPP